MVVDYINNLKTFCNSNLKYKIEKSHLTIFIDNESVYDYDFCNYIVMHTEKNKKSEVGHWDMKKESDYCFALLIKGALGKGIVYEDTSSCERAESLEKLYVLMKKRFSETLFSIEKKEQNRLSLIKTNEGYQIEYSHAETNYVIEKSDDKEYIFSRFYNEVLYLEYFRSSMKEYLDIFGDQFSEEEKLKLINY